MVNFTGLRSVLFFSLLLILACARTIPKPLPHVIYPRVVYPFHQYPLSTSVKDVEVAVIPFAPGSDVFANPSDTTVIQTGTVLNVLDAGIQPIRLIIWNNSQDNISIFTRQIFGIAESVVFFPYPPEDAVNLVVSSRVFQEALKGSRVGPMVRSLLGGKVFLATAKSGVAGLATGGVVGGTTKATSGAVSALMEPAHEYENHLTKLISKEYHEMAIKDCTLFPGQLVHGLVFMPSHSNISTLRIIAYNSNKQEPVSLEIDFSPALP